MFINHISSYMPTRMPVRFQTRRRLFFGNLWGFGDIVSDLQGQIDALNAQIADLEAQKAQAKGLMEKQKLTTQIAALKAKISPLQHKIDMIQDLVSKGYTIDEITAAMNAGKTTNWQLRPGSKSRGRLPKPVEVLAEGELEAELAAKVAEELGVEAEELEAAKVAEQLFLR
jgi:N-methylhydantoinase A/oxoprolinase/acetone carboxylase beta subunit